MDPFIAYLHYISFMTLFACLVSEHLLFDTSVPARRARQLGVVDTIYGISAAAVLATGLLKWFVYGKGSAYYLSNWLFHFKLTCFILAALLSIWPTIRFIAGNRVARQGADTVLYPKAVQHVIRVELLLIALIPLLAALMARGYGA